MILHPNLYAREINPTPSFVHTRFLPVLTLLECSSCAHLEEEAEHGQPVFLIMGVGHAGVAARVVNQVHLQ